MTLAIFLGMCHLEADLDLPAVSCTIMHVREEMQEGHSIGQAAPPNQIV